MHTDSDHAERDVHGVEPVVRHRTDRIRHRRRTVGISRRTQRRFTRKSGVNLPAPSSTEAAIVVDRKLHKEVMLLLPVVDGVALADFSRRKKAQRTATRNCPRLRTHHRSNAEAPSTSITAGHEHAPVDAAHLPPAGSSGPVSIPRFMDRLDEKDAIQAEVPAAPRAVHAVHRRHLRHPRRP